MNIGVIILALSYLLVDVTVVVVVVVSVVVVAVVAVVVELVIVVGLWTKERHAIFEKLFSAILNRIKSMKKYDDYFHRLQNDFQKVKWGRM